MSNKRTSLNADAVKRLQGRAVHHADPVAVVVQEEVLPSPVSSASPEITTGKGKVPPSRAGKVAINLWTTEKRRRTLKTYAVTSGKTLDELMTEAMDDLIAKHGIRED